MYHKEHRHNSHAPLGIVLGKLALRIVGAVLKKRFSAKAASTAPSNGGQVASTSSSARLRFRTQ